jgi:hypothetical protein
MVAWPTPRLQTHFSAIPHISPERNFAMLHAVNSHQVVRNPRVLLNMCIAQLEKRAERTPA